MVSPKYGIELAEEQTNGSKRPLTSNKSHVARQGCHLGNHLHKSSTRTGLARIACIHRILVILLPKMPYIHHNIYMALANPKHVVPCVGVMIHKRAWYNVSFIITQRYRVR